jgi:predicted phage-related endonuclease
MAGPGGAGLGKARQGFTTLIERRSISDRDEWLAWRREDITASRVGALFGVHPYETALRLYAEQRGVQFENPDSRVLRRGRWLEPAVAKAVEELRPEWKLEAPNIYLRDPDIRLGCTPDFYIHDPVRGLGILQAKSVAPSVYARDWLNGSEIPFWIVLQTLVECMLSDAAFGVVAALLVDPHAMDVAILEVPRHADSELKILVAVQNFWRSVASGIEPDPDFAHDADVIKALRPRETPGKQIDFSRLNSLPPMLEERAALMADIKKADARCDEIETEIKHLMGDAESANGLPDWKITYRVQKRAGYTVPPKEPRVLLIKDKRPQTEPP